LPRTQPFESHHQRYEDWFEEHRAAYASELLALRPFVPWGGRGLEIGVGTARFAAPLGVRVGVDPSIRMLARAARRGIEVVASTAEALPFADQSFDYALVVTTICFVDSPQAMMAEARRVLRPEGALIIGFVDRDSPIGQHYVTHRSESVFYRDAVFYPVADVDLLLRQAGFTVRAWGQTLSRPLSDITEIEPLRPGTGRGAFVVVVAGRCALPSIDGAPGLTLSAEPGRSWKPIGSQRLVRSGDQVAHSIVVERPQASWGTLEPSADRDAMTPEEILRDPRLTEQEKADLLCRMSYDAAEEAVALEEGMPGADDDLQRRVLLALARLHRGVDLDHTSPTKQHGTCLE